MTGLLDLLVPPACVACRALATWPLCAPCRRTLPWLTPGCPRCALPAHRRGCPAAGAAFDGAWSPLAYEGPARALVLALKRQGALTLAPAMAAPLAAGLPAGWSGIPVVPVPPARGRQRARGFDPAFLLARDLARRTRAPFVPCLKRRRHAPKQALAPRSERLSAGRIAIEARTGAVPERVLLADDVHTTGATLDACARALKAAGAREVLAVAYARTL